MNTNQRLTPSHNTGLSTEEVEQRKKEGLCNTAPEKITKTNGQIVKDNVCTLFNLFNFIIAICLVLVGAYSNMFFILIIIVNISIGIFQEIHAKNLVEELSLLSMPKAYVVRNSKEIEIEVEALVLDDIVVFDAGRQVCADSVAVHGEVEVNESLLTGESDAIIKKEGDIILSGSFIISGKCYAKVEHIGLDNYASKISHEAKKHKKIHSELLSSMRKVTKITAFLIIPLGAILFSQAFLIREDPLKASVVATAAALLGMLPKGLALLISITLATGVIKLSKRRILVEELYALESLAHVDVLCLDKTGTITEGKMSVQSVDIFDDMKIPIPFETLIGSFLSNSDDNNATFIALKNYFESNTELTVVDKTPFSSQRKWSSITFKDIGSFVLGAPERISNVNLPPSVLSSQESGARVLLAGFSTEIIDKDSILNKVIPIATITIEDPIRENATETLDFFRNEGVDLKIISGDNPITVSAIARKSGLKTADAFIDMSEIKTENELYEVARNYSVFGRVSPQQKRALIKALKDQGHTVAMTGDGVNDILALREADCSIAMAEGSDATRQVSQLVLLDSDFSALPFVLSEGRRSVNNVSRVAGIFFVKTIYSVLLSFICILANIPFPFIPIQITLIDLAIEGYPSFFMSFEPDNHKVNKNFLRNVFRKAIPNAITIIINILIVSILAIQFKINTEDTTTIMYSLVGFAGIMAVYKACIPFNKLRIFLCSTMTIGFYVAIILFHKILHATLLTGTALYITIALAVFSIILERIFAFLTDNIFAFTEKSKAK